jgi:hypothetical protein
MKKLLPIICIAIGFSMVSCKKSSNSSSSNSNTMPSCGLSTWKYEVILGTPVTSGTFLINYYDAYKNLVKDTSITTTWTKSFEPSPQVQYAAYIFQVLVQLNPTYSSKLENNYIYNQVPGYFTNQVTVNIYEDGVIQQTTGGPIQFCYSLGGPTCGINSTSIIAKNCQCQ